ncbi:hypothetical protein V6N11_052866 [Hibiscus sabdariffa]|uniref:BZIP domain-containing protein n=1 Tax=Hibiscus sabdariffa TaxID=183260 RepID=A0ABR2UBC2_9ROSI
MDQVPPRVVHHRRAHSDTAFRFDDLLLFDPSDLDLYSLELPASTSNPTPPPVIPVPTDSSDDSSNGQPSRSPRSNPRRLSSHFRSLSFDSDFFDGLGLTEPANCGGAGDDKFGGKGGAGEKRFHHRHSNSMDGTASFEFDSLLAVDGVKKAIAPDRLAELALIDPKRAKRILTNRQSAARSKERKIRYTSELERKVQTLQTEATNLSAQVTMLERDTTGLTTENKELKLRLQAMEQQAQLKDALNESLREEVQRLKIHAGQLSAMNGKPFNGGLPQFFPHQPSPHHFSGHQSVANDQHPQPQFMDFNRGA